MRPEYGNLHCKHCLSHLGTDHTMVSFWCFTSPRDNAFNIAPTTQQKITMYQLQSSGNSVADIVDFFVDSIPVLKRRIAGLHELAA
ncbi:hypothetical protein J6590_087483 [Homalodisca vitripennis]|nr:hypothetical protein J6590_087483 [Homalodisca vitripennis]